MFTGSLKTFYDDRINPIFDLVTRDMELKGFEKTPVAPRLFANAGRDHMEKYGSKEIHFAKIAEKNHRHSANNPYSQFRDIYTVD